jgi:hypothetical protein
VFQWCHEKYADSYKPWTEGCGRWTGDCGLETFDLGLPRHPVAQHCAFFHTINFAFREKSDRIRLNPTESNQIRPLIFPMTILNNDSNNSKSAYVNRLSAIEYWPFSPKNLGSSAESVDPISSSIARSYAKLRIRHAQSKKSVCIRVNL